MKGKTVSVILSLFNCAYALVCILNHNLGIQLFFPVGLVIGKLMRDDIMYVWPRELWY